MFYTKFGWRWPCDSGEEDVINVCSMILSPSEMTLFLINLKNGLWHVLFNGSSEGDEAVKSLQWQQERFW